MGGSADHTAAYGAAGPWVEHAGYAAPAGPSGWAYVPPRNDPMAISALVVGILGNPLCCTIAGPVAVGLGVGSLNRIKSSNGSLEGRGMAIAGIVLGALGTAWLVVALILLGGGWWAGP